MKLNKNIGLLSLLTLSLSFNSCSDDTLSRINTSPEEITELSLPYTFTKALQLADNQDYMEWLYNYNRSYLPFAQASVAGGGNGDDMNIVKSEYAGQADKLNELCKYTYGMKKLIKELPEEQAVIYKKMNAILDPLVIHIALWGTDLAGNMPYLEVGQYFWGGPLTPKFETQEELYKLWLEQLNATLDILEKDDTELGYSQFNLGAQDFVFKGDYTKWAKFTNSLKLRIAARLINKDPERAKTLVKEVVAYKHGYMDDLSEDYLYNVGTEEYHFGEGAQMRLGSEQLLQFLVKNKDPRVLSIFTKNQFNSEVVDRFLVDGVKLPTYIEAAVNVKTEDGKTRFDSWKAPGEPWVRYYGAPIDVKANKDGAIKDNYFNLDKFKLTFVKADGSKVEKNYQPLSLFNEEMVRGQIEFTYPSVPEGSVNQDKDRKPWHYVFYSSGEANLYLAEFALLGVALPQTAEAYFKRGVELSVRSIDKVAKLNDIPYYRRHAGFGLKDEDIALKESYITDLLAQPDYQLTGTTAEKFEKVYMQQYITFLSLPNELFVLNKRSGFPYKDGVIFPRVKFDKSSASDLIIPRRFIINTPSPTDKMAEIKIAAYREQGFTLGTDDPAKLANERIWWDKESPDYGVRPSYAQ